MGNTTGRNCNEVAVRRGAVPLVTASSAGTMESKLTLGFLGLGIMGTAMVHNLLKSGYNVTVWNRSSDKCQSLVDSGASQAPTPAAVASKCDITFAMLADPTAALEVACGENGVIKGLTAGKGYVDVSTIDVATAQKIAESVRATGATYLEAPVSGSKKPAEDGQLIFLTAGDRELFDKATPAFETMGKAKFYLGEVGQGAKMKLVVNMVMGSVMASLAEGLSLGEGTGLDPTKILEVLGLGSIQNPMFAMKGPSMIQGNFPPAFPLKHQQKDLRLAVELGLHFGQKLPVAAAANGVFEKAIGSGLGDKDFSAVYEEVRNGKVIDK